MNIFFLSSDTKENSEFYCDKHVVKIITEIAQMLTSAAIRGNIPKSLIPLTKSGNPMKVSHPNHPMTKWVGDDRCNFLKACEIGLSLCEEYTYRYEKTHYNENTIRFYEALVREIPDLKNQDMTIPPVCISPSSRCNTLDGFSNWHYINKYRAYYWMDKREFATWKNRETPWWFNSEYFTEHLKDIYES